MENALEVLGVGQGVISDSGRDVTEDQIL